MLPGKLVWILFYCCVLGFYLHTETGENFRLRAVNKILLAALYLGCGWVLFLRSGRGGPDPLLLAGLCLAFAGDVWLLWDFNRGGACFAAANFCLFAYEMLLLAALRPPLGRLWWLCVPFGLLWGVFAVLCRTGFLRLPEKTGPVCAYMAMVTIQGGAGFALTLSHPPKSAALLGAGMLLSMGSDYLLMLHRGRYGTSRWILRGNSLLYFSGMLLAALSLG